MDTSPIRFTGLFSGMDTAGMVQQLMRAESMRMDRFVRRRQMLAWRQEDLRGVITSLERFQSANTGFRVGTGSINDPAIWNTVRAGVSALVGGQLGQINPPGFTVSQPSSNARIGIFDVRVYQVAHGDMYRGTQFHGTADGFNVGNPPMEPSWTMREFADNNLTFDPDWSTGTLSGFTHLRDEENRFRYDLSSLDPPFDVLSVGTAFADVGIRYNAAGQIIEIRDTSGGIFELAVDDDGYTVLRYEVNPGEYIDIIRADLQDAMGPRITDTSPDAPDADPADRLRVLRDEVFTTVMINGADVEIHSTETIQQFMDRVNRATVTAGTQQVGSGARITFDAARGMFILESTRLGDTTVAGEHARIFTGADSFGFLAAIGLDNIRGGDIDTPPGPVDINDPDRGFLRAQRDAIVYIDDHSGRTPIRVTSQNNTFTGEQTDLRGISFTISNAAGPLTINGDVTEQLFRIDTRVSVDDTVEAIRRFIDDFNNLIRALNALHATPRPRSQQGNFFEPLTDAEREAMSDREIERWEDQARIGLLHRNDSIRNLHQDFRRAMFEDVRFGPGGNQSVNLSEFLRLGTGNMSREDMNIGVLDVDWDRIRTALEDDPDRVRALFSRSVSEAVSDNPDQRETWTTGGLWNSERNNLRRAHIGFAARLDDIVQSAVHIDGAISRVAGYTGRPHADTNPMSRQLQAYDARLRDMQRWLIRRENHFFAMFARMEQAMANANAQMDSLWMMGGM